jgi:hypothetical protein
VSICDIKANCGKWSGRNAGMSDDGRMRLLAWRPLRKGRLLGFCTVELPIGLQIREVALLRGPEGLWAALPAKPEVTADNQVRTGPDNKPLYRELLVWRSRRLKDAFSTRVIGLVREAHQEDLE